jgi:diacyltrehalose acyltransferase
MAKRRKPAHRRKQANWRRQLVPMVAATSLLLASGPLAAGVSQADEPVEQAVLIPGATVFKRINPLYPLVAKSYPSIGEHFYEGDPDPQVVKYSQNALDSDRAIADGVVQASAAVRQNDGKVVIIGESMGSMVAWRVAQELANSPDAPPPEDVRVVLIAPPEAGVAEYFKEGTYIPILNYRVTRIAQSPYDTTIVIGEYDGWSDPPDRPWNLVASANALAGIVYVHGPPSFTADVSGLPPESVIPRTDEEHGSVTTYLVPTENLPLTQVFRDVGVPDALVDKADDVLRPVIDAGYVRHDQPGDTRPYLHDGEIHRNVQSQQQVREPSRELAEAEQNAGQERREHRSEVRQAIREDLRDRVEAGIGQLKERVADRQAAGEDPAE